MQKYQSIISGTNGSVIRNVPVTVLKEDGSLAEIFMDREGQVQAPNPLVTDSRGVFYFYAKNGRYSLRTAADGVQITDADTVLLFDPDETATDGPIADAVRRAEDAAERAETALGDSGLQNLVQDAQDAAANAVQAVIDANQAVASIDAALIEAGEAKDAAQAAAQTASNAAIDAQAVKDSLLTYSGTLSATPEWSAVPAHEDPVLDAQTQAALNRVEKLKDDQQLLKQRADKAVLSYPDYAAASAAAATLPDGQFIKLLDGGGSFTVTAGGLTATPEFDFQKNYVAGTIGASLQERVSVKAFPWLAKGDSVTDDTAAIRAADAWCAARGLELFFPDGVYRCTDGIDRKANWRGVFAPQMAPFPLLGDDKQYLRPGYKDKIPGSALLFTGVGTLTATTQRSDAYASFTYCVRTGVTGQRICDLAIILDCDVLNSAGNLTQMGQDNVANYGVGHYIDDVAQTTHDDVVVFGYFPVAGTVLRSELGNDDPDYTLFRGGSTMGRHGLALIGSQFDDGRDSGLSGTQVYGLDMFTLDHHSRGPSTAAAIYANAGTWRCLYIDGWTDAEPTKINGHYFFGGSLRTYAIHPVEFGAASHINMYGVTHETSNYAGVPNAATKQWLASELTYGVHLSGVRFAADVGLFGAQFGQRMRGQLVLSGCPGFGSGSGLVVGEKSPDGSAFHWIKVGGASGGTGDPQIQISKGQSQLSTTGWGIRVDIDQGEALNITRSGGAVAQIDADGVASFKRLKNWPVGGALTVSGGAITVTQGNHVIDATGSPTVTTINGGVEGEVLKLGKTGTGTVTLAEGGNIVTPGTSVALSAIADSLVMSKRGSIWVVDSFSDNA